MQELSRLFNIYLFSKLFHCSYIFHFSSDLDIDNRLNEEKTSVELNIKNNQLGYYLAGLIEADGSIIVSKEINKNTPTISISFNIIDKPLAICIKNRLGFGSIENVEKNNAVKLIIRGKYNILFIISLINGKFRTPKIDKLHILINYVNAL
jgi:LAGLIDADG endonuclease